MHRRIYRAIIKACHEQKALEQLMIDKERLQLLSKVRQYENLNLFKYNHNLFLYFEFEHEEIFPEELFCGAEAF